MFSTREAKDEMKPVNAEMSVSAVNESKDKHPRQLLHGDSSATFATLRAHPAAYKKPGPRITSLNCSLKMTDLVPSLTYNEAEVFRPSKKDGSGLQFSR